MRIISTKLHGIADYLYGTIIMISPWIFGFDHGGAETWIPVFLGAGSLIYSLFTNYEMGAKRKIPMQLHISLDIAAGILLALSPWLFGFADYIYQPHLIMGIITILIALLTDVHPSTKNVKFEKRHS